MTQLLYKNTNKLSKIIKKMAIGHKGCVIHIEDSYEANAV